MASPTQRADTMVQNLSRRGYALPRNEARARLEAVSVHKLAREGVQQRAEDFGIVGSPGASQVKDETKALIKTMGERRAISRRVQSSSLGGGDTYAAIPRFYDPLEYWDLSGLPWNVADEGHRHKLHKWLRLYKSTHYLIPILIDIFTRFPLVGMELTSKDAKLTEFYENLFLDQLNYPEFLVDLGSEFWTVGEAFSLGSFDEDMGIWEHEELINPEDVVIENFPLLGSKQLKIKPPDYLKKLAQTQLPAKEYRQLEINFPEIIPYLRKNEDIPMSDVLLKQIANLATPWDDHGTPILLRGLRTMIHEEKLLASQDAIAERLYSPLILAQLGLEDLGDGQGPWIPGPEDMDALRDEMDVALSSDFRLLVHHVGLKMENVFGREQMPRLGDDFDRIEKRIMQIFGVNPSLLSAGSMSQPYASSALQAEFLNQILRTFQGFLKRHYRDRAMVVAEAQGHYDYEKKGQTRVPIYEEVVVEDPETGKKRIEKRHKLLIPDMEMQTLDMRDEATERQYLETMRQMGVPIPDSRMMIGIDVDIPEMVGEYNDELVEKTVKQQEGKMKAYKILQARGLPIPADLKAEVEAVLGGGEQAQGPGGLPSMPGGGGGPGGMGGPTGGPGEGIVMPPAPPGLTPPGQLMGGGLGPTGVGMGAPGTPGSTPAIAPNGQGIGNGFAPPASFERRPGMPRPAHKRKSMAMNPDQLQQWIQKNGPYVWHGRKADVDENYTSIHPEKVIDDIMNQGLLGNDLYWDHPSVYLTPNREVAEAFADEDLRNGGKPGALFRVDLSKLDPANIESDEWQHYGDEAVEPTEDMRNFVSNPHQIWEDLNNGFSIAHRGNIPPEAVDYIPREENPEFMHMSKAPPMMTHTKIEDDNGEAILYTLPKAVKKKSYSFIDPDAPKLEEETEVPSQESDESNNQQSSGPASGTDSSMGS